MADHRYDDSRTPRRRWWAWLLIIAAVLAGAYWFWGRDSGSDVPNSGGMAAMPGMFGPMQVPVRVATAEQGTIDVVFRALGTVTPLNTVTVRSRVEGELQKIYFQDGQKVKEGDLLAQIDPRPYQVRLDQAKGQQQQNRAQLENARRDLQRYQLLFKQNSIARQQVDTQAALVQQLEGSLVSDQAAVDDARLQLSFTRITAPISGRLGLRTVDQGNLIAANSTDGLVVITQTQPIAVLFTLPQAQLPPVISALREGRTLPVELYDSTDTRKLATGQLVSIDNQIDVTTGTLRLKAQFDNEDEILFPNQFVNVRLGVNLNQPALVTPTRAIQQGSRGAFVYVVTAENKVRIQPVVAGTVDGSRVAIESGLQAGDQVVIEGVDRLREGAAVEVVKDDPAGAAAGASPQPARPAGANVRTGSPH